MLKKKIHHDDSGETFVKKEDDRLSCVTRGTDLDNGRAMAKANKKGGFENNFGASWVPNCCLKQCLTAGVWGHVISDNLNFTDGALNSEGIIIR